MFGDASMDISVLPNNNHPDKFLQLDVNTLTTGHGMIQVGAAMSSQRHWQNRVYSQVNTLLTQLRYMQYFNGVLNTTPQKPQDCPFMKNPLYLDIRTIDTEDNDKFKPSWTVKEYDTQTVNGNLGDYLKKTPRELDFWLEDLYTPGYDSLLKKEEAELKRKKLCKILLVIVFSLCVILVIIVTLQMIFAGSVCG
uniref:Membrane integral NOTCH2 associated receptor 2 n=1 Tax=Cynoglossus semilaevis TaxID=244447 RepID=A0A3P8VAS0_CYNSE